MNAVLELGFTVNPKTGWVIFFGIKFFFENNAANKFM